jgi:SAM-dependent methyltransferase
MKDFKQILSDCSNKSLEERKSWYSPSAEAYNKTRPRYDKILLDRVAQVATLSANSNILELGCGPGTATVGFARLGCSMLCLEPNSDFCYLARQNCQSYPNVEICNTSFEEWQLQPQKFDAVLAATSFHWISPEVSYRKVSAALKEGGYLILLWNMGLEPEEKIGQVFRPVYQEIAPSIEPYEGKQTQQEHLQLFGEMIIDSGKFKNLVCEQFPFQVTYSADDYLMLLSSYSPYINLKPQNRERLFAGLKEKIEQNCGSSIQLSYISAFQIAQKC